MARRTALITGASAGIGVAFADVYAAEGYDLVLVARRRDRLDQVAARLQQEHPGLTAHVIVADLSERDAVQRLCEEVKRRALEVDALVNNAGYGVAGVYGASPWTTHEAMLQVMVIAVAELTHRLLPGMLARGHGHIINVASLAGLVPAPAGHTLYAATKALLIKFSEALSHETAPHGVHVTALCPGFTFSEFHDIAGTRAEVNRLPSWMWLDAPTVARQGYDAVVAGEPIYINGRVNRVIARLVRYAPRGLVRRVGRSMGRKYRKV